MHTRLNHIVLLLIAFLGLAMVGCFNEKKKQTSPKLIKEDVKNPLINANRHLLESEESLINDFVRRYNWKMQKTPSGLRYLVYLESKGRQVQQGDTVTMQYETRLLDGKLCYSSALNGPRVFIQGHAQVEKGLEEGILLLRVGDRAKFIIPSHLAFGLLGDQQNIPARSVLIYDIELVNAVPKNP